MSDLLNLGVRALQANQIGLTTTGHNISNASTAGYSRQTAVAQQVVGQFTGSGYIGNGVEIGTIQRAHSDFLTRQATSASSVAAADSVRADRLASLEDVFQGGTSGLGSAVSEMLNSLSDVASAPTDITARNVVIARGSELASRFKDAQTQLDDLQRSVNSQLQESAKTINSLAGRIAQLNGQIALAKGNGQPPNDLLDQRDQLMSQLSTQVQNNSVEADDGSLSVFVGGQALVLGTTVGSMAIAQKDDGTSGLTLTRSGQTMPVEASVIGGGQIAGLLKFQNQDLASARDGLGRLALTISTELNAQHRLGLDMDGQAGGDFFTPVSMPAATGAGTNTGNAVIGATIADASALVATSYSIQYKPNGTIDVTRSADGKLTNFSGPMPITIDGLSIDVASGAANVGDVYTLKPYATAAGQMGMAISSARELAAGSQVQASAATGNTGTLRIGGVAAEQPNANLTQSVTLTFTAAGTFDVAGTGTGNPTGVAYTAGQPVRYNGWSVNLTGTPKPGDTITIQAANPAYNAANAGNASALMNLRDKAVFDGAPLTDGYAALMADVGVRSQSAQYASSISGSIASSLETQRSSVSGVNLDEEAAKLLQYQQAYQASAKLIQIAQSIFDTLIQGMR